MDFWIVLVGPGLKLLYAMLGVVGVWAAQVGLNKINRQPYSAAYEIIAQSPDAMARYRGYRWIGLCLLFGLLLYK